VDWRTGSPTSPDEITDQKIKATQEEIPLRTRPVRRQVHQQFVMPNANYGEIPVLLT
jgi:hypothetical protein